MNPLFPFAIITGLTNINNNINQNKINTIRKPLPRPAIVMPQLPHKTYNPYAQQIQFLSTEKLNMYNKENQIYNINYKKTDKKLLLPLYK